ncbi:MAG: TraB/GumN family protein, partial [Sphingopyxis sp.]|nr:TraB/GumN family protein [Sphingopyxis sp.]
AAITPTGIPPEAIDSLEPWFSGLQLALAIYAQMGFQPGAGAEAVLKAAAGAAGKPISGFETVEQQIGFLDSTPESEQIAGLIQFFERGREMPAYVERLLESWTSGSPEATAAIMNEAMATSPETARILLTDRNRRWADTLQARMDQPGTVFVAVGAGHLAGEGSVQQFLAERGLTAERVAY